MLQMCRLDRWIDAFPFYVLFHSITVISGPWEGDSERLRAVISGLQWKGFPPSAGIEIGLVDQKAST